MIKNIARSSTAKLLLVFLGAVALFGFANNYESGSSRCSYQRVRAARSPEVDAPPPLDDTAQLTDTVSLPWHPFDNACKFPMANIYEDDVSTWRVGERLRTLKCEEDYPMATQDSEGYIYVHPHFNHYPNVTAGIECKIVILEGGLRDAKTNKGKDDLREVASIAAPDNKRLWVNADAFYVRCADKNGTIEWEKPYAGIYDEAKPKNKITVEEDLASHDTYGRRKKSAAKAALDRLSIDILGFDSTSRTMFFRHLPRTVETMNKLGYEFLHGYNKVGDNSMVNLAPILAGDVKEALLEPPTDESGDVNADWILPTRKKLDPTTLPFLWKWMSKEFGCESMLNEDISMKALGLFHYPSAEFLPGFTEAPASHFYRAYYLAVYKNWKYRPCRDGRQVQEEFVDIWHRFAAKFKNKCHFGFTFVTTLTHETGMLLELLDEHISSKLENLYVTGALDNTVSVLLGDHGNRIGLIQYSYTGRIEERMPLMAMRFPPWFRKKYPKQYQNFLANKWKLTSNFDIHQTLKDIARMEFGGPRRHGERGISLFDEIPESRTCFEAYVPENFCACLVDRSNISEPVKNFPAKSETHRKVKSLQAIKHWLRENSLTGCVSQETLSLVSPLSTLGLNALARHGIRTKTNVTKVEQTRNDIPKMDFLHHEMLASVAFTAQPDDTVTLLFRVDEHIHIDRFRVVFEPSVREAPPPCHAHSLFDVCRCLGHDVT